MWARIQLPSSTSGSRPTDMILWWTVEEDTWFLAWMPPREPKPKVPKPLWPEVSYSQVAPTICPTVFPTFKLESVTRVDPIFLLFFACSISLWGMVAGEALFVPIC